MLALVAVLALLAANCASVCLCRDFLSQFSTVFSTVRWVTGSILFASLFIIELNQQINTKTLDIYLSAYLSLYLWTGAFCRKKALDSLAGPSLHPQPGGACHVTAHLTEQSVLPQHQTVLQPLTSDRLSHPVSVWAVITLSQSKLLLSVGTSESDQPITMQDIDLCSQLNDLLRWPASTGSHDLSGSWTRCVINTFLYLLMNYNCNIVTLITSFFLLNIFMRNIFYFSVAELQMNYWPRWIIIMSFLSVYWLLVLKPVCWMYNSSTFIMVCQSKLLMNTKWKCEFTGFFLCLIFKEKGWIQF